MATVKIVAGVKTALACAALPTLASATYAASSTYNSTTNQQLDLIVEALVGSTGVVAGNKQVVLFAIASYDGVSFQTGPTSGTTTTDEPQLTLLGTIGTPLAATTAALSTVTITGTAGQFSCAAATLVVGQPVTISGTFGGTGSITGYATPTTYIVSATNGSTTFTLTTTSGAAIVTTAGTPTGLTYTQYTAAFERRAFSVASAFGGVLPPYVQVIAKNDLGVALTLGALSTVEISSTVV